MLLLAACSLELLTTAFAQAAHPIRKDIVDRINQKNVKWTAHQPEENPLAWLSREQIVNLLGLRNYSRVSKARGRTMNVGEVPDSFDARDQWPDCKKPIRNQQQCGSCWAFAAAETLTDNLCILGQDVPVLSPQELVSCDNTDHGCKGGNLQNVWDFIDQTGLVSDDCMPYTSGSGDEGTCSLPSCSGGGASTKYSCPKDHSSLSSDSDIQAAVMKTGAVEVGFTVYEDFMNYQGGVYSHSEGKALGGHAVKIVGWGQEDDTFYWIVQNSWGPSWGEDGYFRIENSEDDADSAIAEGGGFACVSGDGPRDDVMV